LAAVVVGLGSAPAVGIFSGGRHSDSGDAVGTEFVPAGLVNAVASKLHPKARAANPANAHRRMIFLRPAGIFV
jgi:hypothetical protein